MDRGAWWTIAHGVAESDTTEHLSHVYTHISFLKEGRICKQTSRALSGYLHTTKIRPYWPDAEGRGKREI